MASGDFPAALGVDVDSGLAEPPVPDIVALPEVIGAFMLPEELEVAEAPPPPPSYVVEANEHLRTRSLASISMSLLQSVLQSIAHTIIPAILAVLVQTRSTLWNTGRRTRTIADASHLGRIISTVPVTVGSQADHRSTDI